MPNVLTLLLQIASIVMAARLMGALFRRFGQPQVVGEMVAGVLLGPSFLGWVAPGLSSALFPAASLGHLQTLSQVGLLLFMFLVGLEFNPAYLRRQGHAAVLASHASISAPFLLGSILALYLYPRLSDERVAFREFALFMGVAMSVTAFPVLARILRECLMGLRPTEPDENELRAGVGWQTAWNGRGRARSGAVEAVRESDPERVF